MAFEAARRWWTQPCGGRDLLRLALPLIVSTASWTVMYFTDRMFLLWHSTGAMAAAMPAGVLYFTVCCLPLGVVAYVSTFVAQYHGAGRPERVGPAVWQGVRIALYAVPVLLATAPLAGKLFEWAGHDAEVAELETVYYQVSTLGGGGLLLSAALSAFFTGIGQTRTVMLVDLAGALLNIALDYAWIFGHWGFPEMGIGGAALATACSQWFQVFLFWRCMRRPDLVETYQLAAGRRRDPELMRRLWRFGGPNGVQMLVEVAGFALFLLVVGQAGKEALAATNLAFNVNNLAWLPMLGMGMAVSTMVGQQLGREQPELATRAAWTGLVVAELYMGALALLYVLVPDLFLVGHAAGADPNEFARIRDMTVTFLRFVAVYCVFDAVNVVFVGVLKGAGDTRFYLLTTLVMSSLLAFGAWAAMASGYGVVGCWIAVAVWCCLLGVIYMARFLQGRWRHMRVIECQHAAEGCEEAVGRAS